MKAGSLVVCVNNERYKFLQMIRTPELEPKVYTVAIAEPCGCGCGRFCITLEELPNKPVFLIGDPMYVASDFREVLPSSEINLEELLREEVPV